MATETDMDTGTGTATATDTVWEDTVSATDFWVAFLVEMRRHHHINKLLVML